MTGIEHYYLVSTHPDLTNDYDNCFYACRLCNEARASSPVSTEKLRLLNPCDHVWSGHFEVEGDLLQPRPGDVDAKYTHEIYDLNDPRKIRVREMRRVTITECLDLIEHAYRIVDALLARGVERRDSLSLEAAEELRQCLRLAQRDIERYGAIPGDAPASCRCKIADERSLPTWLDAQTFEV